MALNIVLNSVKNPFIIGTNMFIIRANPIINMFLIKLTTVLTTVLIAFQAIEKAFFIFSKIPPIKSVIPFQIFEKNELTPDHNSSQLVPNQDKNTSVMLKNVLIQFSKVPTIKSQTEPNISLTPFQTRSQSPVNIPTKMSNIPRITLKIDDKATSICLNVPIKSGAINLQKADQMAFITSVMSLNLKPRALSLSTIP